MAFTVKNYMARGVNLENAYFKINQFSGSKTGGYSAQFDVYVSKSLMYSKAKTLSIFTGKDVQDC